MMLRKMLQDNRITLEARALVKRYVSHKEKRFVTALSGVSFSMEYGLYGLLGPNGAGKSTLINILTNNLTATSGAVFVNGYEIIKLGAAYRSILSYQPQQQTLYSGFTGRYFLSYMAALKGVDSKEIKPQVIEAAHICNLTEQLDKKIGAYSGGMKQRLVTASAFIGNPKIMILDEPTAGLDPKERVNLRNHLKGVSQNCIVIVATHVVSDIEKVADKILLLKHGELIAQNSPEMLIETYSSGHGIEEVYLSVFDEDTNE